MDDILFYCKSCEFIKDLMKKQTPMEKLAEIVYPLLKLLNPKVIDKELINLTVLEQPHHNYSEYFPLAYHILKFHPDFYTVKNKELAAFAWEIASRIGCDDGTDDLFEHVIYKIGKHINYDYLEETSYKNGASSIAHEVLYCMNSKSKFIPKLLDLGANITMPSNNYNSALDSYFLKWVQNQKENIPPNDDLIESITIFLTDDRTKSSYIEHLEKYPSIKKTGIIQSTKLNLELKMTTPLKNYKQINVKI